MAPSDGFERSTMKTRDGVSAEIKRLRRLKKMSQEPLAKKSRTSRATLISIERNSSNMSLDTFLRLAHTLEMEVTLAPHPAERGQVGGRFPNFQGIEEMKRTGRL
jgi:transcriptional regulator with XRE-family HTH domain